MKQQALEKAGRSDLTPRLSVGPRLQRKCACGTHTIAGGECDACGRQKQKLQRYAANHDEQADVPEVVNDVLRSPGKPLDAAPRAFMESRFGHDFSHVRVHTDEQAGESARSVNAHAYTLDHHILFDAGQYAPETNEGQRLLAHELTHVLQQTAASGVSTSDAQAEHEAEHNSQRLVASQLGRTVSTVQSGHIQRQEKKEKKEKKKPEAEFTAESSVTEDFKDKFGFEAEVTVPLTDKLTFGSLSFLDELKLTGEGGVLNKPFGVSLSEIEDIKLKMALTLAKYETAKALKRGKLNFGATLSTSGGPTFAFDPNDITGSLGLSLTAKAGATTPSLIPAPRGKLTLGTTLSTTGSLTQTFGGKDEYTPKAESKLGVAANYESAASRNPALTLGGLLGDKARFTAGLEGDASGSLTADKTGGKLGGSGSIGLTGTRKGVETYVKLKVTGNISIDQKAGSAATTTGSTFLGITTGVKF